MQQSFNPKSVMLQKLTASLEGASMDTKMQWTFKNVINLQSLTCLTQKPPEKPLYLRTHI